MFNWVCPECGRTVDLSEKECPSCRAAQPGEDAPADRGAQPDKSAQPDTGAQPDKSGKPAPARGGSPPAARPHAFALRPGHVAIFLLAVLAAIGGALYMARPELLQLDRIAALLPSDRPAPPPAPPGPVEVAGVRVWIDEQEGPRARALLVNHAAIGQRGITATVRLTSADPELEPGSAELGEFRLDYADELAPRTSVELDAPLRLAEGVNELPPRHWILIAVDFRR